MPNKRIFKKLLTLGNSTFSSDLKPDILSKKIRPLKHTALTLTRCQVEKIRVNPFCSDTDADS